MKIYGCCPVDRHNSRAFSLEYGKVRLVTDIFSSRVCNGEDLKHYTVCSINNNQIKIGGLIVNMTPGF